MIDVGTSVIFVVSRGISQAAARPATTLPTTASRNVGAAVVIENVLVANAASERR